MKKILAIVLMMALVAVLACSAFASGEPSGAPAAAPAAEAAAPTPVFEWRVITEPTSTQDGLRGLYGTADGVLYLTDVIPATGAEAAGGVTWADYQAYLIEKAGSNAPDLAEFEAQVYALNSWADVDQSVSPWDQFFTTLGLSTWDEFQAGVVKDIAVSGSGEASGEAEPAAASGEPAAQQPAASGEPAAQQPAASGEPAAQQPAASGEPAAAAPAEEAAPAVANPDYDPGAYNWASIEIVMAIIIIVVGAVVMLSFGKKKVG